MYKIYLIVIMVLICIVSGCTNESYNSLYYALEFNSNYTYDIKVNDEKTLTYLYNDGNIEVSINDQETRKITYLKDDDIIIKTLNDGKIVKLDSSSVEYGYYKNNYLKEVSLKNLNWKDFSGDESYYSINSSILNNVSNMLFNDTIKGTFTSLDIRIFAGKVYEIKAKYVYDNIESQLLITFSHFNSTIVEIPDFVDEPNLDDNPGTETKKEVVEVVPSKEIIEVEKNTTLIEALEQLFITVVYDDESKETYNVTDLKYICENYNSSISGTYLVIIDVFEFKINVSIVVKHEAYYTPTDIETLDMFAENHDLTCGMPSTGNSKALVIPVEFIDYKARPNMKSDLEKAFFGTSQDTGWESLTSYYKKSSYGKLNIEGTVMDVYNTRNTSRYYNNLYERGQDADYMIIKDALEYYDDQIDYSEYDSNDDGYIDALYIVYTTPIDYNSTTSMWWAYTYEYFTNDYEYYDGVEADYYCFLGYDFLFEETSSGKVLSYNTETIIHETGHLLGLDDYYDYDDTKGPDGGIGGGDMMDYNVGDHNPFSKILLGWVTPYVVTESSTVNLSSFGQSGDCIMLIDNYSSIYDEYYLIDFYTPDGLNKLEAGCNGLFSKSGIRIYHVDARITKNDYESILEIYDYDNSYTSHRLLSLIQTNGSTSINKGGLSSNSDLLDFNKDFEINTWYKNLNVQFVINAELKDDSSVDIKISKK